MHDRPADPSMLIERVQRGDHVAFGQLYDELASRVYGVVKRVVRDRAMSEEVTQEVFTGIWTNAARYDATRASVTGWATVIARRRAIDRVRSEQSRRNRTDAAANEAPPPDPLPESVVTARDEAQRVRAAMATLPDDQREVVELALLHGRTHQDVADSLGLPLGTVKGRVRLALKRLRAELGDRP